VHARRAVFEKKKLNLAVIDVIDVIYEVRRVANRRNGGVMRRKAELPGFARS